jgi:dienelactone hydrolase
VTTDVEYAVEGTRMIGRLALPDSDDCRPAVLIAHDGSGLDNYQKGRAARFAELGYVAFALDYHGAGRPISEEEAASRCQELWFAPERIRVLAAAGLEVLLAAPRADASRVAAVGYCFGGAVVLELGRAGADVQAIVGFHPRLATRRPEDAVNIGGKVLVLVGTDDPFVSRQERIGFEDEMRAGGVNWQMNVYGGAKHSFTRPGAEQLGRDPGNEYDQLTDQRSWRAMLDLFDEELED